MKTVRTILILISVFLLFLCSCTEDEAVTTVAVVNGETVTQEEFDYFKARQRANVINYYISEFNAKVDEDFWQKDFNGITPEKALENALIFLRPIQFIITDPKFSEADLSSALCRLTIFSHGFTVFLINSKALPWASTFKKSTPCDFRYLCHPLY